MLGPETYKDAQDAGDAQGSPRLLQDSSKTPPPVAPHEAAVTAEWLGVGVRMCWSGRLPPCVCVCVGGCSPRKDSLA